MSLCFVTADSGIELTNRIVLFRCRLERSHGLISILTGTNAFVRTIAMIQKTMNSSILHQSFKTSESFTLIH
jgi:hypothetical protein